MSFVENRNLLPIILSYLITDANSIETCLALFPIEMVRTIPIAIYHLLNKHYTSAQLIICLDILWNEMRNANGKMLHAASHGQLEVMQYYINNGANFKQNSDDMLNASVVAGHVDIVAFILEEGKYCERHIQPKSDISIYLPLAVYRRHYPVAKVLLAYGVDVNSIGNLALINAVCHNDTDMIRLLLDNKAICNISEDEVFGGKYKGKVSKLVTLLR